MEVTPAMYAHFVNLLSPLAEGKICLIQEVVISVIYEWTLQIILPSRKTVAHVTNKTSDEPAHMCRVTRAFTAVGSPVAQW